MEASVAQATSVHYVAMSRTTSSEGDINLHFVASVGVSSGTLEATWSGYGQRGSFTIVAIGPMTYLKGDASSLATFFEAVPVANASTYAGRWISFTPRDAPYRSLRSGDLTVGSVATSLKFLPTGATTMARTIVITGRPLTRTSVPAGTVITATTTISRTTKRPISQSFDASGDGSTDRSSITFSQWDAALVPTAPGGSITWASVDAALSTTTSTSS